MLYPFSHDKALILPYEPLEIMQHCPVKDGLLRMSRTIDSPMAGEWPQEMGQIAQSQLSGHSRLEEAVAEAASFLQIINRSLRPQR